MRTLRQGTRRWRKNGKRGVSPIIATILLVAITVVLAAVLYILISGLTKGPGNTPLGTALALSSPREGQGSSSQFWYNFSVTSASGGLTLNNLAFQVQTPSGSIVSLSAATVTVNGISGTSVGTYSTSSNTWSSGGTTTVSNQMTIVLESTTSLSGDVLYALGSGSFSGQVTTAIP